MEQVTLQAIKQKQLSRSKSSGITDEASEGSDGFMQLIDSMLENIIDGNSLGITDILSGGNLQNGEDVADNASLLSMLSELLQSNRGNLSNDILSLFQSLKENVSIDSIEIPNIISKLQQNNFLESMGMSEDAADTLYTLGNNTYNYIDAQVEAIRDYINSRLESGEANNITLAGATNPAVTATMQTRTTSEANRAENAKLSNGANEIPITSVSYEKSSETQLVQPTIGVTVPNMVSQRIVKADLSALEQLNGDDNNNENQDFSAQLSEIALANANSNAGMTEIELPKVQNLSNSLFNEFNVSEQITDGVKANINLEKSEFTVKLNPEELGELTLKLIEENGKMVLDITAASEKTARMLNGDIAALRESVGSMNIEVREVTVSAPEEIQENSAQFNMTSQQFSEQQRAFQNQQQQGEKPYYAAQHGAYATEEVTADYAGRIKSAVDGLDTYV
ncbi:MAG: flagellar hook-length control protein FliK [Ruminococcaceae bacterium]|nr:flagellar hook-length control protein FliK [Oscillospiraceae bacterium]